MPNLPLKYTLENPYVFIDRTYGARRKALYWEDGKIKQTQYARWLWVKECGPIPGGMTVHHINHDKLDDRLENYELKTHSQHAKHHHKVVSKDG